MSIRFINKKAKCPEGYKLAGKIASYLFAQEYGECERMTKAEIEILRKACKILQK
jgi:hypothetical protein